ncbi:uncharacterized protein LOC124288910 [Haliotis rubra]|uniref:uncharacterized protein LOC124288910 n=1 Tax=Haliotis rubra TaxID=36100 RepID=UPI001EE5509D|nr:uncharacterized protein LOC124288910 [Haliotis rubra]
MPTKERTKRKREEAVKAEARKCRRLLDFFAPKRPDVEDSELVCYDIDKWLSSSDPAPQTIQKKKDAGHKLVFDTKWKQGRPWLKYVEDGNEEGETSCMMFCSLCTKWNMKGRNGSEVEGLLQGETHCDRP